MARNPVLRVLWAALCVALLPSPSLSFASTGTISWGVAKDPLPCSPHRHPLCVPRSLPRCPAATTVSMKGGDVPDGPQDDRGELKLRGHKVFYKVTKPNKFARDHRLPVVILHGGPGVPSDYLYPLSDALAALPGGPRTCYLYDQLGCGLSSEPPDFGFYSPSQTARDCADVLSHFADKCGLMAEGGFHLYGQSWGGCVAAETVLAHFNDTDCLREGLRSVIFSGTPASPMLALETAGGLIDTYNAEIAGRDVEDMGMPEEWPRTKDFVDQWCLQQANEKFVKTHNLRMDAQPEALNDAYSKQGTVWRGAKAVADYAITEERFSARWPQKIPALCLRGEHDFVTIDNMVPFLEGAFFSEYVQLRGASHQAHLEDTAAYVAQMDAYLRRVEAKWARQGHIKRILEERMGEGMMMEEE